MIPMEDENTAIFARYEPLQECLSMFFAGAVHSFLQDMPELE
jgi:hypothetical protein